MSISMYQAVRPVSRSLRRVAVAAHRVTFGGMNDRGSFRANATRVLLVQLLVLAALWLLQSRYTT